MIDWTTKALAAIALGLWPNVLGAWVRPTPVSGGPAASCWFGTKVFNIKRVVGRNRDGSWRKSSTMPASCSRASVSSSRISSSPIAPWCGSTTSAGRRSNGSKKASRRRTGRDPRVTGFERTRSGCNLSVLADNLGNLWRRQVLPKRIDS